MKKYRNFRVKLLAFTLVGLVIIAIVFVLKSFITYRIDERKYRLPGQMGYQMTITSLYPESKTQTISTSSSNLDPILVEATQFERKYGTALAPAEITSRAANRNNMAYKTPEPGPFFQVSSIEDIPKVIFNDPFFGDLTQNDFGQCLQENKPGSVLYIKSKQRGWPDYYLSPFYNNNGQLCGLYKVEVENGMGVVKGWSEARGNQFPPIGKDEAGKLVEKTTGKKIASEPQLVFQLLSEAKNPFAPFWQVQTADGQMYYVIYTPGIREDNDKSMVLNVYNVNNVHPINP